MADIQLPANLKSMAHYADCYIDSVYVSHDCECARIYAYFADSPSFVRVAKSEYEKLSALVGTSARLRIGLRFSTPPNSKPVPKWWVLEVL